MRCSWATASVALTLESPTGPGVLWSSPPPHPASTSRTVRTAASAASRDRPAGEKSVQRAAVDRGGDMDVALGFRVVEGGDVLHDAACEGLGREADALENRIPLG